MTLAAVEQPDFLTISETARLLRISKTTCYQEARAGRLAGAFRIGMQIRVDRVVLVAWIRQQAADGGA